MKTSPAPRKTSIVGNLLRGALIGAVETIPGVSGGTVALVTGIYDDLIVSAHSAVSAARVLVTGPDRWEGCKARLAEVNWRLVLPVVVGMAFAVLTVAGPISHLVKTQPEPMRALFLGLVLGSITVPLSLAGGPWKARDLLLGGVSALLAFALVSAPAGQLPVSPLTIIPAAAVAVSALLLPGVSGSFILLTLGLYAPTLEAVSQRNLGYLAVFSQGLLLGGIFIVQALRYLLTHHHRATMIVLAGLMLGALRSLWPWQSADRALLAPAANWLPLCGLFVLGVVLVQALVLLDRRAAKKA
ncbi:DUF368 domain-containing protein [Dermabacteraceae bacterium P9123]